MSQPTVFTQTNELLRQVDSKLKPGDEFNLRGISLPHFPIADTGLAACLGTLDIPFREPAPYTSDIALDEKGNPGRATTLFWLGDKTTNGTEDQDKTEWLMGAWIERAQFERDHPTHPIVAMRAALDARSWWLNAKDAWQRGRAILPIEAPGNPYIASRIHEAAILKAHGYAPVAFNGRAFFLDRVSVANPHVVPEALLIDAAQSTGREPCQWMSRVLANYSHLVKIAKAQSVILRHTIGDQTVLLTADSEPATRDKFFGLLS